ncbi:PAS domain S-box protein [Bacillus taeanensis]|uniref:histidine kinase n=1 Tax=Bacillus taeanensis TaxID=273032 RepID=A0A366XQB4_9BACI|nr:PAS domain S-box protein [Bacillus taeanensis]RBW68302.1 PAS domain-containing sensor histidine kinase [Bacillus taeanensis]
MITKEFFINLSIFTFLVSMAIGIRIFVIHKNFKFYHLFIGLYAGSVAAILMFFPVTYNGWIFDLRAAPFILSFVYFGRIAGWITTIFICISIAYHYIGGHHWIRGELLFFGTALLFTVFKTYFPNLHPLKNVFLYLIGLMSVHIFLVTFFSSLKLSIAFEMTRVLCLFIGLLMGIFLMESYQKLYRLTQDLSKLNQSLTESKQELRDTVREQQGVIFKFKKVNERFIYTLFDGQLAHQLGIKPQHIIGKTTTVFKRFLSVSTLQQVLVYYERAWKGESVTFEMTSVYDRSFIVALRPLLRNGQEVVEIVGSIVDITALKRVEEELWATKERLKSFINHNTDAIIIFDLKGHILQANKAYEEIFGWSAQEILGVKLPCVPDFLMDQAQETIQKIIFGEPAITKRETVRQRKDGSLIDISMTLSPILDSKRNVIALSAIYRDITERKQVERELHQLHQQLKESEMKYRVLFEQAADAVYLVELNEDRYPARLLEVNPVGCERFDCSREELLSMPYADIVPQNSTMLKRSVEKIREGKRSFTLQDEFVFKKTGKKINNEFSVRVFNLNGKEVILLISRDITERLKTEELLRKSEKLAVVGKLATAIAHEIRNPLTSIKGFMQLLKSTENKDIQCYVEVMLLEIEQIEDITNEFMSVAKPQAVKMYPNDLQLLVEQIVTLFQSQATMNNVKIRREFESDIPLIPCEKNQLKQVFINIMKNAIEAMPAGGEILVQINKLNDHQVNIRFTDQGCGIPPERIPYLGEPFYSIKEEGIGLGLTICYKIVETLQGKIVIESEVDKGTTVDVVLPIYPLQNQSIHSLSGSGER